MHECTRLALFPVTDGFRLGDGMNGCQWFAFLVVLAMNSPFSIDLHVHLLAQRIDATHAHAVQAAADLITVLIEFTTGMQYGHYHFQRTPMLLGVHIYRNTATVILHSNGVVGIDMHSYLVAEASQCLINRVVHYLIYQMVQTFLRDVSNVHCGAFTNRLQTFEHLNTRTIILFLFFHE